MIFKNGYADADDLASSAAAHETTADANTQPHTNRNTSTGDHRPHARETREHAHTRCHIASEHAKRRNPNPHTQNHHHPSYHHPVPTNQIHTRQWQQRRAHWQTIINQGNTRCWRCTRPIPPNQPAAWQLGHTRDRAAGGTPQETLPECQPCNSRAGGQLGAARRWHPPALPSRAL